MKILPKLLDCVKKFKKNEIGNENLGSVAIDNKYIYCSDGFVFIVYPTSLFFSNPDFLGDNEFITLERDDFKELVNSKISEKRTFKTHKNKSIIIEYGIDEIPLLSTKYIRSDVEEYREEDGKVFTDNWLADRFDKFLKVETTTNLDGFMFNPKFMSKVSNAMIIGKANYPLRISKLVGSHNKLIRFDLIGDTESFNDYVNVGESKHEKLKPIAFLVGLDARENHNGEI